MENLPTRGWEYLYCIDTCENGEELHETCDFCGTSLRYKHYIQHPEGIVIGVGCICCDMLTRSYIASTVEANRKRDLSRIRTLVNSPRWKIRKNGHFILYRDVKVIVWDNADKGFCLQLQRQGSRYDYYWQEYQPYWYYCHRSYHDTFLHAVETAYYNIVRDSD